MCFKRIEVNGVYKGVFGKELAEHLTNNGQF